MAIRLKLSAREEALALVDLLGGLIEADIIRIVDRDRFGRAVVAHINYFGGLKVDPSTGEAK